MRRFVHIWTWRVIIVAVLLSAGIVTGSYLGRMWTDPPPETQSIPVTEYKRYSPSPLPAQPQEKTPALDRYHQLWSIEQDCVDGIDTLIVLAKTNDGPGYHARVALARSQVVPEPERLQWYQSALSLYNDSEVRIELAHLLLTLGVVDQAITEAASSLPDPAAVSVLINAGPSLLAAEYLIQRGLHTAALDMLTDMSGEQSLLLQGRALSGLGHHQEAIHILQSMDTAGYRSALPDLALTYERCGDLQAALDTYSRLGTTGAYGRGRVLHRLGRTTDAIHWLLTSQHPEAMWTAARLLETGGQYAEAVSVYEMLMASQSRVADDAAFRAWLVAGRLDQNTRAESAARYLPADSHWQYEIGSSPSFSAAPSLSASDPPAVAAADALLDHPGGARGLELAAVEIAIAAAYGDRAVQAACGQWYLQQNMYHQACRLGISLLSSSQSITAVQLAYPLAYWDLVMEAGTEYGVDPLLIVSVMREESHFLPTAVSRAGALGLMQIMPATGSWIAGRLGKTEFNIAQATDPATNIRLGTWYLRYLLDLWDNDINLALASYNGGQGNVSRWLAHPLYRSASDFYVTVDYQETREYISKVRTTLAYYEWLYNDID